MSWRWAIAVVIFAIVGRSITKAIADVDQLERRHGTHL